MQTECDILVIGGGIAGSGIAAELSTDHRVVVLEREEHAGFHATGRSAAMHSEIYGNARIRALSRASRQFFLQGVEGRPFATDRGFMHIATEQQLDQLEAFAASPDISSSVDRLTGAEACKRVPVLRSDRIVAALAERHAYDLDVDSIQQFYLRRLRENGGAVRCASPVCRSNFDGAAWIVEVGEERFRAPLLINAAGAWGDVVAELSGVSPIGLEPRRRSALIVDAPANIDPSAWPAVIDIGEQFYFKPEAGKILMSPADETPCQPCDAWPEDLDLAIAVDRVQQVADLPVIRIEHSWAGLRTFAPDKTPVAGFDDDQPNFFWLVGQGGYGIQTAPALSRLAAAMIRREDVPDDLAIEGIDANAFSPSRFFDSMQSPAGRSHASRH